MKVLLLEDDPMIVESLKAVLESENIDVDVAMTADEVYEKTFNNTYDLYLFDINLPGENGIEVAKNLKNADDDTPVIFITALTDIDTIKQAFTAGAVDYIKKPFDIEEALIRIKSKLVESYYIGNIKYNSQTKEIYKDGVKIRLSPVLMEIFDILIKNKGRIVEKNTLLNLINNESENSLRVNISKLKKILGVNIKAVKNQGYVLE